MGIIEEDIARVRSSTDFIAIASEHIALKRVGRQYQGLCPFHSEKSPSFSINPDKGVYFCYGCGAKGDVISFVRDLEHLDFGAAVERLAAKAGIALTYSDESGGKDRVRKTKLIEAMEQACAWYHNRLLTSPDAGRARAYLRSRGYDAEAIKQFKIGWAPEGWDTLVKALHLSSDVARDTGLGYMNKVGKLNDFFQARILFPIFDTSGAPIAFGGRKLPETEGPKYKNSSETKLYSKSRTLYGLNWAKTNIVAEQEVIVCEGYTDVIGFHRAGMPRAVATCGTALADDHFRMLKNFARRIVLAYDADNAGQSAAAKFYTWERTFEIDLFVVALPPGADPADLARNDPDALAGAVKNARPFLQFRIERLLATGNLKTPEGRARAFEQAALMILEHPNALVREQYLRQVAGQCQISEDAMAATLEGALASLTTRENPKKTTTGRRAPTHGPNGEPLDRYGRPQTFSDRSTVHSNEATTSSSGRAINGKVNGSINGSANTSSAGRVPSGRSLPANGSERAVANEDPGYDAPPDLGPAQMVRKIAQPVRGKSSSASTKGAAATTHAVRAETEALRWAVSAPERIVPWLDASFFVDPVVARSFALLMTYGEVASVSDAMEDVELVSPLDRAAVSLLHQAAVEVPSSEPDDAIALIVDNTAKRVIAQLAAAAMEGELSQVSTIHELKHLTADLHEPLRRTAVLNQLVPWLAAWAQQQIAETPETT